MDGERRLSPVPTKWLMKNDKCDMENLSGGLLIRT